MASWQDAPIVEPSQGKQPAWMNAPIVGADESKAEPNREVVATTDDGGIVFRGADGALSFTSPGYSTNDPDTIKRLMDGATVKETVQSSFDKSTIEQAPIASRAVKAIEGTPFIGSYVDEAVGVFSDDAKQGVRAVSGAMDREKPGQSAALQIGGALAGAAPMALAAAPTALANAGKTLGARALQAGIGGAILGATEGAVYGSGKEGDRSGNAQQGLIFGGLAGSVLGAAAPYASEGVKRALSTLKGSDTAIVSRTLGISSPAARVVKNALDAGDMDEAIAALNRAGPDAMLADAGLPAAQLLDASAATGGAAARISKDAVEGRVTQVSSELTDTLNSTLGNPAGIRELARAVRDETSGARNAVYEKAYSQPIDYSGNRGKMLESLLRRVPKSAIEDANALMRANGEESAQIIARVGDDGNVTFEALPDVRQIDYITRALSGVADKADGQGKLGGQTPLGSAYNNLTKNIRNALKGEVPAYKEALDVASDAISRVKAGELGYALLRPGTRREDVARAMFGATDAEKKAARQGARSYIDDTLANVARTITDPNTDAREATKLLRDMSSRANKEKMQMILGKPAAEKMFEDLDRATVAFELRAALAQNSKTAIRQSIQDSVGRQTASGTLESLASGEPLNASKRFVQIFTGNTAEAQALREAGIFEEIATALTQTKGDRAKRALQLVEKAMQGQRLTEAQASVIGNVVAGSAFLAGNREASRRLSTQ